MFQARMHLTVAAKGLILVQQAVAHAGDGGGDESLAAEGELVAAQGGRVGGLRAHEVSSALGVREAVVVMRTEAVPWGTQTQS